MALSCLEARNKPKIGNKTRKFELSFNTTFGNKKIKQQKN